MNTCRVVDSNALSDGPYHQESQGFFDKYYRLMIVRKATLEGIIPRGWMKNVKPYEKDKCDLKRSEMGNPINSVYWSIWQEESIEPENGL